MGNKQEINFMNGVALGLAKHAYKNAPKSIYHTGKWVHMEKDRLYQVGVQYNYDWRGDRICVAQADTDDIWITVIAPSTLIIATFTFPRENARFKWGDYFPNIQRTNWIRTGYPTNSTRALSQRMHYDLATNQNLDSYLEIVPQYSTAEEALDDFYHLGE